MTENKVNYDFIKNLGCFEMEGGSYARIKNTRYIYFLFDFDFRWAILSVNNWNIKETSFEKILNSVEDDVREILLFNLDVFRED